MRNNFGDAKMVGVFEIRNGNLKADAGGLTLYDGCGRGRGTRTGNQSAPSDFKLLCSMLTAIDAYTSVFI